MYSIAKGLASNFVIRRGVATSKKVRLVIALGSKDKGLTKGTIEIRTRGSSFVQRIQR